MIVTSCFFFVISLIFFLCGLILLSKYSNDIGISLHAIKILNIYGINFVLLAICFSSFSYQFLLETIVIMIINSLCSLTLLHILFKKSNVGDTEEYAKKREKTLETRNKYFKEFLKNSKNTKNTTKSIKINKTTEANATQTNETAADEQVDNDSDNTDDDKIFKPDNEDETNKRRIDFSTFFSDCMDKMEDPIEEPDREDVNKAIDDTEEEIRKQKRALKKKIEDARKSAYATRKSDKILETEKIIKEVLDKYGLTEEMLSVD